MNFVLYTPGKVRKSVYTRLSKVNQCQFIGPIEQAFNETPGDPSILNNYWRLLKPHAKVIGCVGAGFLVCCTLLAMMAGNIGFQGDDWWVFSFPFWNSFPQSLLEYTTEAKRPVEGLYWITMFEFFRFHQPPYFLFSLFLLGGSCFVMGLCLFVAFPDRQAAVVMSTLLAFVLPPVSSLTYMIHTDNSRISMLLFWASVFAFQHWAAGSRYWGGLIIPLVIYCVSVLTYENTSLLIFSVPLFVFPVDAARRTGPTDHSFSFRLLIGIFLGFGIFVLLRFLVFSGGAVGSSSLIPKGSLVWTYISAFVLFLITPFLGLAADKISLAWGGLVGFVAIVILLICRPDTAKQGFRTGFPWCETNTYLIIVGLVVCVLGTMPYLIAGYRATVGFTSQSRIYSSGSFGIAIMIGFLLTSPRLKNRFRWVATIAGIVAITLMAGFFADLRKDWKQAATMRKELCTSLLNEIPDAGDGTTFLFLDLQSYISNRSVIFQGVEGLREFVRMVYRNKSLDAYFLYPKGAPDPDKKGKLAVVSQEGVMARGSAVKGPSPLNSLLILERKGTKLVLLDSITVAQHKADIDWCGVTEIRSNLRRILPLSNAVNKKREICDE